MTDWKEKAFSSHYQTAVAVKEELDAGHLEEATEGLDELIDAMARIERRAVRSQLTRLMHHVLKWLCQPTKRCASWAITIANARQEIEDSQEEVPSISREVIEGMWGKALRLALSNARQEMGKKPELKELTWRQVFEDEYSNVPDESQP